MTSMALALVFISTFCVITAQTVKQPNIVYILADDLGWNDVSWNNPDIISPNLDSLAKSGIIMDQHYMQPLCSPSRAALMTGYYPFRMGLQHQVIMPHQDVCAPDSRRFLSELLKNQGYKTHAIGKWHLGYCKWECTPTYRGFDSFYGFYVGAEDYTRKIVMTPDGPAIDFWINKEVGYEAVTNYSAFQFADRAEGIIRDHDTSSPLFIYLPFQNIHGPLQVPDEYSAMYPNVTDNNRKIVSGMVTAMDDAVGQVVTALKVKGLYDNTIIIFASDNGGWTQTGGNNYPLRGGKISLFEGGTRVPAFVHSPLLNVSGQTYSGMFHVVDWFSTIAEAAGINYNDPDSDGMSQWQALTTLTDSPRTEFIYNLDYHPTPVQGQAAIRAGDYKLVVGFPGIYQDWYLPGASDQGLFVTPIKTPAQNGVNFTGDWNFLFNLKDDPEERKNLFDQLPQVVADLSQKLADEMARYVAPNFPPDVPESEPILFNMTFSPGWC